MSERTHSPDAALAQRPSSSNKLVPILAGTAVAVVIAGIAFQVFRASDAKSDIRDGSQEAAGSARIEGTATPSGTTLALVNSEPITWDMVAQDAVAKYGEEVLDNLINHLIIQQECERRGVAVTTAEVQQEVLKIAAKFNLPVDTWYQMIQSERGMSAQQYHRDVIWPMLALKKLAGAEITITPEELQQAFERDFGPRVKARMIVLDGNMRQATAVLEQVKANPDDFERLAVQYSVDPNSRALGGVVQPIPRHSDMPHVETEAFRLREGEISPLVQFDRSNRWVIIKSEGLTEQVVTDITQVREELTAQLIEEKTQAAIAKVFEDIHSRAVIHNHLTGESTANSQFARGREAQPQPASGATASSRPPAAPVR
jgi:parvulin-like peptidyl-prolyl isomerase